MSIARTFASLIAVVAISLSPSAKCWSQQKIASSKIVVEKTKITFDPKTCTEGRGMIFWGLGSSEVKVLGRRGEECVFEYTAEVEMGAVTYLVPVAVDAGPVIVEAEKYGRGIVTSFPLDKAKVIRRAGGPGFVEERVGDTEEFIRYQVGPSVSDMQPRPGDSVKFRVRFYESQAFERRLPNAMFDPALEIVAESKAVWPWLELAMRGMTVGDRLQVHVPMKVAEGVKQWLPKNHNAATLYVELRMVALERAK